METLPLEIYNYIIWLSSGPINSDIYNNKKSVFTTIIYSL